jgi:polysaccharide pyruvyl transferase WcaK-like protein
MNILILNNTSAYHNGSKSVMSVLCSQFPNSNITLKNKSKLNIFHNIDLLVVNGEGTMHDDAKKAKSLLESIKAAKKQGIKTMLVNTVWQRNSKSVTELLRYADYISVREVKSKKEIQKVIDIDVDVNLDLSYFYDVPYKQTNNYNIVSGNYFVDKSSRNGSIIIKGIGEDGHVDLFNESWNDVVNKLRHSKLLVTGRHHEMYAACKAECPFIVLEGNTHKNSGLFETFEVDIPTLPMDASLSDIRELILKIDQYDFKKLFSLMKTYKQPQFYHKQ